MTGVDPGGRYRVFGLRLDTARPLRWNIPRAEGDTPSTVRHDVVETPLLPRGEEIVDDSGIRYHAAGTAHEIHFPEGSGFVVGDDGAIRAHAPTPLARSWAEIRLLGPVLSFWLEKTGLPVLHGSALRVGEGAIGFLGGNRAGKTSLAAALLARGHALLTDDLLAVETTPEGFTARPGYPQMRLWPDAAAHWLGAARAAKLPRVHPSLDKLRAPVEAFHGETLPPSRLYLPEREGPATPVRIEPVKPRDAVFELLKGSFIPRLAAAAGWEARRFDTLARLARAVPVRRLVYPDGFERLPEVIDAVLADD